MGEIRMISIYEYEATDATTDMLEEKIRALNEKEGADTHQEQVGSLNRYYQYCATLLEWVFDCERQLAEKEVELEAERRHSKEIADMLAKRPAYPVYPLDYTWHYNSGPVPYGDPLITCRTPMEQSVETKKRCGAACVDSLAGQSDTPNEIQPNSGEYIVSGYTSGHGL